MFMLGQTFLRKYGLMTLYQTDIYGNTIVLYLTARDPEAKTNNSTQTIATFVVLILGASVILLTIKKSKRREADRFIYLEIKAIVSADTVTRKKKKKININWFKEVKYG